MRNIRSETKRNESFSALKFIFLLFFPRQSVVWFPSLLDSLLFTSLSLSCFWPTHVTKIKKELVSSPPQNWELRRRMENNSLRREQPQTGGRWYQQQQQHRGALSSQLPPPTITQRRRNRRTFFLRWKKSNNNRRRMRTTTTTVGLCSTKRWIGRPKMRR